MWIALFETINISRLFSDVWSEIAALFKRLIKIHSNPPIVYYGFNDKNDRF